MSACYTKYHDSILYNTILRKTDAELEGTTLVCLQNISHRMGKGYEYKTQKCVLLPMLTATAQLLIHYFNQQNKT